MALLDFVCEQRGTLEDPNVPLSAENAYEYITGNEPSASGVAVSDSKIKGIPAVWRGIVLLGSGVADLPLKVYKNTPEGKIEAPTHPAYFIVHNQASQYVSAVDFWQTMVGRAVLGNGYAEIVRGAGGTITSMWLLDPLGTWPVAQNGVLAYKTMQPNGPTRTISADNMFHLKGYGDGIQGISVVDVLRDALGLPLAHQGHESAFYANNCATNLTIEVPGRFPSVTAYEEFRKRVVGVHGEVPNAFRPMILTDGAKANAFPINHADSQFLQSREFSVRQIANIMGVPPHKLGDSSKTAFNSLESENKAYLSDSLGPWLKKIEAESNRKLLTTDQFHFRTHFFAFVRDALLQGDRKTEAEVATKEIFSGVITINDRRRQLNQPAYDIPEADLPLVPANMVTLGTPQKATTAPAPVPDTEPKDDDSDRASVILAAHRAILAETCGRFIARVAKQAKRRTHNGDAYMDWCDHLADEFDNRQTFLRWLLPVAEAAAAVGNTEPQPLAARIADELFAGLTTELLRAAEVPAEKLPESVASILELHAEHGAQTIATRMLSL